MKYLWLSFIIIAFFLSQSVTADIFTYLHLPPDIIEKSLIEKREHVLRDGDLLSIPTAKGIKTYQDRINAGEGSAKYRLVGIMQGRGRNYTLVQASFYESRGYELVNYETGETIFLSSIPKFSEDWSKFIDVSLDLDAGYMANVIRIFKLDDSGYVKEWEHLYTEWEKGPTDPVWLSNSAIVFFEAAFVDGPSSSDLIRKPFIIEFENGKWNGPRPLK